MLSETAQFEGAEYGNGQCSLRKDWGIAGERAFEEDRMGQLSNLTLDRGIKVFLVPWVRPRLSPKWTGPDRSRLCYKCGIIIGLACLVLHRHVPPANHAM